MRMNRPKSSGCGCFVAGMSTGIILSAIIPSNIIVFIMAVILLIVGFCLLKRY